MLIMVSLINWQRNESVHNVNEAIYMYDPIMLIKDISVLLAFARRRKMKRNCITKCLNKIRFLVFTVFEGLSDDEQHLYSAIYLQKHSKAPGSLNMSHIIRNVAGKDRF